MDNIPENRILCHPDKIELLILNTANNRLILPEVFPELISRWTDRFDLRWRHERAAYTWKINGWNNEIRLSLSGPAKDLINDSDWKRNPFGKANVLYSEPWSRRSWMGILRITDKTKVDPQRYCDDLSKIFEDFERFGIEEKPRIIEIALDCYGDELTQYVRQTIRLYRDNPSDFCNYRDDDYYPGGSLDGSHTEYSMRRVFHQKRNEKQRQNSRRRELVCYSKPDYPFYRVELRLGYRYLEEFHESKTYHHAIESMTVSVIARDYPVKIPSRTLDLLGFIPCFVNTQIRFDSIDLDKLYRKHRVINSLELHGKSLREQRYRLSKCGITPRLSPVGRPRLRFVLPRQIHCHT